MTLSISQQRTFPSARPIIPGLDYYGDWRPARGMSGDYIDYFEMNGNLGLAVGDVCGKGVPANLLRSSLHSMIRALRYARNFSLKALVRTIDKLFSEISPDKCYATLFVGEYDPSNGQLHYVNAGHESPFVLRKNGTHSQTVFLEPGGPVIGLLRESTYRERVVSLAPGDVLVAYTDGLCDSTNGYGEQWGWPRFLKSVEDCAEQSGGTESNGPAPSARDIVEGVLRSVETFAGGEPPHDDVTLFVGRVQDAVADTPWRKAEQVQQSLVAA